MKSSPADLAVAFRSLTRRLHQAQTDDMPASVVSPARAEIDRAVSVAAAIVRSPASADAVAAAIESRHANEWDDADLDALRELASSAARAIRTVEDATPR